MNAITQLFKRDQVPAMRGSERIREELNALPHPQRYSDMLVDIGRHREKLKGLAGQQLKDAEVVVAGLEADAAAYRSKHSGVFDQCDALSAELCEVLKRERQVIIADRMDFHAVEAADANRQARLATDAATELLAQRVATHMLAKSWGIDTPWTFGFPPAVIEQRAREIVAELQSA